jgi:hypothetical protein
MKFKVGDVCLIIQGVRNGSNVTDPVSPGEEVTVTEIVLNGSFHRPCGPDAPQYGISGHSGIICGCALRLKRPPREELGSWSDCVWKPSGVTA